MATPPTMRMSIALTENEPVGARIPPVSYMSMATGRITRPATCIALPRVRIMIGL